MAVVDIHQTRSKSLRGGRLLLLQRRSVGFLHDEKPSPPLHKEKVVIPHGADSLDELRRDDEVRSVNQSRAETSGGGVVAAGSPSSPVNIRP